MKGLAFAVCFLALSALVLADSYVTVNTPLGPVQGVASSLARSFKGIPYAEPPVGQLRWAAPVPKTAWAPNTLLALNFGHGCPQRCELPPKTCPDTISEDCLTLNVFTPAEMDPSKPAPVMVFLPGGRFEQGSSGTILYDGSLVANRSGVIIVTTNYRLGALGWLACDAIPEGNLGLEDQRVALRWVRDNIASFGGDPKTVTLFGQSAGATSTATHLTSPRSIGLFHRAIIQSSPLSLPNKPKADAHWLGNQFAKLVGCASNDIQCLRSVPVDKIVEAQKEADNIFDITKPLEVAMPWVPIVDETGTDVIGQPMDMIKAGKYQRVPLVLGTVWQDALPFIYMGFKNRMSDLEYSALLLAVFPQIFGQVIGEYPPTPIVGDKRPAVAILGTDYIFDCPTRYAASMAISTGSPPVYVYNFNHSMSFDGWGPNYTFCIGKVCHGVELPFLFGMATRAGYHTSPAEEAMSEYFAAYWTNFARTGNPNVGTQSVPLEWPSYNVQTRPILEIAAPKPSTKSNYRTAQCNWWDSKGYIWGWANNS